MAVACSGGVDSSLLADVAHEVLGEGMVAVTAVGPALPPEERQGVRELAASRGWAYLELEAGEIEVEGYRANGPDRCYHCKTALFSAVRRVLPGFQILVGTNADDLGEYRPGLKAAEEQGVRSPLAEVGLTKEEVRALARERGLPNWSKPASPCLASRVAHGVKITRERLERLAAAEGYLRARGFRILRVRDHGDLARVEVPVEDLRRLLEPGLREGLVGLLRSLGFRYATLDLEGFRSGSLTPFSSLASGSILPENAPQGAQAPQEPFGVLGREAAYLRRDGCPVGAAPRLEPPPGEGSRE